MQTYEWLLAQNGWGRGGICLPSPTPPPSPHPRLNIPFVCKRAKNKKSPRGIGPRRFPPPLGVQIHYGHSRYVPKWYKVLKLVIFLTFEVCAAIPPPPTSSLHPSPCDIMDPL